MPGFEAHIFDITRVIQLTLAPVFLLTAIGTIINALMGRLARAVDRRRFLEEQAPDYAEERRDAAHLELLLLNKRISLVLWSVALAVLAALLVCLLVGTAFAGAFIAIDLSRPVAILFIGAVGALTGCLLLFLHEIAISALSTRKSAGFQAARADLK
jgi:small-conductance mechanosensitive channel